MRPLAALTLALSAVLVTGLTACQPMAAGTGALVHCSVTLDRPAPDNTENPRTILSGVRFWCEDPGADRLSLTLRMQRQNARGIWIDVATRPFTVARSQTVRTADQRYQTRAVTIRCATGIFRTTVAGQASGAHTFAARYDLTGPETTNPCDERLPF